MNKTVGAAKSLNMEHKYVMSTLHLQPHRSES